MTEAELVEIEARFRLLESAWENCELHLAAHAEWLQRRDGRIAEAVRSERDDMEFALTRVSEDLQRLIVAQRKV